MSLRKITKMNRLTQFCVLQNMCEFDVQLQLGAHIVMSVPGYFQSNIRVGAYR